MIRILHLAIAFFFMQFFAHTGYAQALNGISGTWGSDYTCDGVRAARAEYSINVTPDGTIQAIVGYHIIDPPFAPGIFRLKGRFEDGSRGFELLPDQWIENPNGHQMVGIRGEYRAADDALDAEFTFACRGLNLARLDRPEMVKDAFALLGLQTTPEVTGAQQQDVVPAWTRSEWVGFQSRLNIFGFDAGPADGLPGPRTRTAIQDYQRANRLPQTGEIDQQTAALLMAGNSAPQNSLTVFQPSFDCAKATTATEIAICRFQNLSALDARLAEAYSAARARFDDSQRVALRDDQRKWLKVRDLCAGDSSCLDRVMQARLREMQSQVEPVAEPLVEDSQLARDTSAFQPNTPIETDAGNDQTSPSPEELPQLNAQADLKLFGQVCAEPTNITGQTICADADLRLRESRFYDFVVARRATLNGSDQNRFDGHVQVWIQNTLNCADRIDCIQGTMFEAMGFFDALYPGPAADEVEDDAVVSSSSPAPINIYRDAQITAPDGPQIDLTGLYPLHSDGLAAYYLKAPFCEGSERAFDLVGDFHATWALSDPIQYRQFLKNLVANFILSAWPNANQCLDPNGKTTVRLSGWSQGAQVLEAEFLVEMNGPSWPDVVRYDLNLPAQRSELDLIADNMREVFYPMSQAVYMAQKQRIADYISDPNRTRQDVIQAYLLLADLEGFAIVSARDRGAPWVIPGLEDYVRPINTDESHSSLLFYSKGPLGEEAYKIASDLGSGVATIDLVLSSGLFEALDLVVANAAYQRRLLPETTRILYDLYASELSLALSLDAILAIKLREKLLDYGIDIAVGLEIDPNAPPSKWDIERAILRAMADNFVDQKSLIHLFAPTPAGEFLLGGCDDTWCNVAGDLWKIRISVRSAECEINLPHADCRIEAKPVASPTETSNAFPRLDDQLVSLFMQGAAPYLPNEARLIKRDGQWDYVEGLELQ